MNAKLENAEGKRLAKIDVDELIRASNADAGISNRTTAFWRSIVWGNCLILALGVLNASAGEPQPAASGGVPDGKSAKSSVEAQTKTTTPAKTQRLEQLDIRPVHRGVTYGGALYEIAKADQPLQILNPFAPARYGSGETNVVRDPITKQPRGVAFFSLHW
jgi:hypothetical protein